jgi:CHAD domain-containing protein
MRAALWSFRPAVPKRVSVSWTDELGWLAGRSGDARDLDVFTAEGLTTARSQLPLPGRDT